MRLLLLTSSGNALTTRLQIDLGDRGHTVSTIVLGAGDVDDALVRSIDAAAPDLVIAPTLKKILPESVWRPRSCMIVHPGVLGDRGVSSLDWAIQEGAPTWGVTLIQAAAEVDAGDVWAHREFPVRPTSKTSLYRHEVSEAAVACVIEAVDHFERGWAPRPLERFGAEVRGTFRPPMRQDDRRIDWQADDTETVLRKIRAADTSPGVLDHLFGVEVYLFGAHRESTMRIGEPGEVFAQRHGAICRATIDGAVWITHLRRRDPRPGVKGLKLPAATVLGPRLRWVPEIPAAERRVLRGTTYRDIWYEERGEVGCIHFDCYNGALGTAQCRRLLDAILYARTRPTKVIVLMGGSDFFCNGIHLTEIEAAPCPAEASWQNILAIDDVVHALIETTSHLVVASLAGDAAAGGLMMALAADRVYTRNGVVMNPHYRALELYGSEYWTYLLPRRAGPQQAQSLVERGRPVGPRAALVMGLIDDCWGDTLGDHRARVLDEARRLARGGARLLGAKQARRDRDEAARPLAAYRDDELRRMRAIFEDPRAPYHRARRRFLQRPTAQPLEATG